MDHWDWVKFLSSKQYASSIYTALKNSYEYHLFVHAPVRCVIDPQVGVRLISDIWFLEAQSKR